MVALGVTLGGVRWVVRQLADGILRAEYRFRLFMRFTPA